MLVDHEFTTEIDKKLWSKCILPPKEVNSDVLEPDANPETMISQVPDTSMVELTNTGEVVVNTNKVVPHGGVKNDDWT